MKINQVESQKIKEKLTEKARKYMQESKSITSPIIKAENNISICRSFVKRM